jgi:hypothetical protein
VVESRLGLDDAARCVVAGWNRVGGLAIPLTHRIDTIDPGRAYEITHQQTLGPNEETYFARIISMPPGSRIEFYIWPIFKAFHGSKFVPTVQGCAG